MALAANKQRVYEEVDSREQDLPVVADDIVYEGAGCADDAGACAPLTANKPFAGFALRKCDNDGGAAGAKNVRVRTRGHIVADVVGVVDGDDVGETVYMTDDDTFTLDSAGNAVDIGKVARHIDGTKCVVAFEADAERSL